MSPSLNSIASYVPVDAPDGTAARPMILPSKTTSVSIVGFPLESNICLAFIFIIFTIVFLSHHLTQ
ncbi:MAG: hypothetical protein ACD_57C00227G0001 [uncultured bacterium]|nr:MAG: hypothetical protein ACD_57C00227G0001 [uncultured bacterium]